jgi:hypothetical protein
MLAQLNYPMILGQMSDSAAHSFFDLDPQFRFVLMIVAIVFGTLLIITTVGILSFMTRSIHHRRLEVALKHDLLDRGMSADEVARVVEATSGKRRGGNPFNDGVSFK